MDRIVAPAEWRDEDLRILILTPHGRDSVLAERAIVRSGLMARICSDLDQLHSELAAGAGTLLISEEALPADTEDIRCLVGDEPPWSSLPIVALLSRGTTSHKFPILRTLERRANVSFLERPAPKRNFISALRAAIEARRLQYRIRQALDELDKASRKKDEFLATLSHELRNPMAPIRSAIYVLKDLASKSVGDNVASRERTGAVLSMMERQTDHLVQLVDDLLEISRITTGKIQLKMAHVRLDDIIRQAVEISEPLIREAGHDLRVSLADEPIIVNGDPVRLTQVISNLLNNSAKYTPPGGRIHVSLRSEHEHAAVSVVDNGIGISQDMLPKIFDLFAQSSGVENRMQAGLGIGLALARSLVEMHGGEVIARSDGPGRGSEFRLRLPLAAPRQEADEKKPAAPALSLVPHRVLVVDDDKDVADSLAMLIESLGADVHVANSGADAISCLPALNPDLVFLDIGMPSMDGYETARRIRLSGADVLLIALSGWGREEDRQRAGDAGFDLHLTKPVGLGELQDILDRAARTKETSVPHQSPRASSELAPRPASF